MINYALSCLQTNMLQSHTSIIGHYSLKDLFSSQKMDFSSWQRWCSTSDMAEAGKGRGAPQNRCPARFPVKRQEGGKVIDRPGFGAWAGSGSGSGTGLNLSKVLRQRGQISAWVVWSYRELALKSGPLCCSVPGCPSVTLKTPLTLRWWQNAFFWAAAGLRVCSDAEVPFTNSRMFFFSFK